MTSVRVPIMFCGEWIEQNGHYRFNGTEARGIMVPRSTTYAQLIEKVSRVICIDISESVSYTHLTLPTILLV